MNIIIIAGRLHTNPARRDTHTGVVATFRLAVTERRHRMWIDVEAWGHLAGTAAAHLTKGRLVGVTGKLRNKPYTTSDGQRRDHWFIAATDLAFLDAPAAALTDAEPDPGGNHMESPRPSQLSPLQRNAPPDGSCGTTSNGPA